MLHIPSMLSYGFLSFALAFLNKALFVLANFRYSLFVILAQLAFIILSFHFMAYFRLATVPSISRADLVTLFIPSVFFCLNTALSLQALMKLNVANYVVIKRCTPALTFLLAVVVLKKQTLNFKTGLCVFTMTVGAILTSAGDIAHEFQSYLIGGFSVLFHSLYLLTVQRYSEHRSSNDVLYINSLLSLPMIFMLMIGMSDELSGVLTYKGYQTRSFWLYFLLSIVGGGLLNGTTFWCTIRNSALTTSVVGILKSVLQIFFGMFTFDHLAVNEKTIVGILLSLIGGTAFSYFEYTDKQAKPAAASTDDHHVQRKLESSFKPDEAPRHSSDKLVSSSA